MMTPRFTYPLLLSLVAAVAAGCASPPSHFYTLNATAKSDGSPAAPYAVAVGPVSIPALVDRPEFAISVPPNRIVLEEFNRWATPLNDNIASVIAGDLAVLLGTPRVSVAPSASVDPAYRVTINVQRFESIRNEAMKNEAVLIEALWLVRKASGGPVRTGQTVAREPTQGEDFAALAGAHSRALAKVSSDIAVAIRAEADGKP
jgi:uncharacterized lipoprotein YmbA